MLDHWRRPAWRYSWGGPFNGQEFRQRLFVELCARVPFVALVETGTYRGTTTRYLHETAGLPIHSFETNPRNYGFARAHLASSSGLHLNRCDSRDGLAHLATSHTLPAGAVFFYLDAHGSSDLPLAREISLAFAHWSDAVVMIDDFEVPDDPGYRFDNYGPGRALTLEYLAENRLLPPGVWFPTCPSAAETGARRGCVVLARAGEVMSRIDTVGALRRWHGDRPLSPQRRPSGQDAGAK